MHFEVLAQQPRTLCTWRCLLSNHALYALGGAAQHTHSMHMGALESTAQQPRTLCRCCSTTAYSLYLDVLEGAAQQPCARCTWMCCSTTTLSDGLYRDFSEDAGAQHTHTRTRYRFYMDGIVQHTHARARAPYVQDLRRRYSSTHTHTMHRFYLDGIAQHTHTLCTGFT